MKGFRIDCKSLDFPGPIEKQVLLLFSKYWLVYTQGGPFSITHKPNFEELDGATSSFIVDVPQFKDTDTHLFRPGVFPQFANYSLLMSGLTFSHWTALKSSQSRMR